MLFLVNYIIFGTLSSTIMTKANISGGNEVTPSFKYTWLTRITKDGAHHCTGILIDDLTLITASHCSKESANSYEVEIHRHDTRKLPEEENSQILTVKSITRHVSYDLAIWKLLTPAQNIDFNLELDSGEIIPDKTQVRTLGWGWARAGGPFSKTLQEVDILSFNSTSCGLTWALRDRKVEPGNHICAGGEGGRDACVGDSGGPLLLIKDNKTTLIGLTSFGLPCAQRGVPSVWTRLAPLMEFINTNK